MTDPDDGDLDDDGLRSLRAVWLSLPDEAPPDRGLAELMAAARVKADEMATPPWWQRIGQLLRRPPVLALASVMVLIGGAVLIGTRGDEMQAQPPATRSVQVAPTAPASEAAQDHEESESIPVEEAPAAPMADDGTPEPAPPQRRRRETRHAPTTTASPPKIDRDDASGGDATMGTLGVASDKATATATNDMLAAPRASSASTASPARIAPSANQLHRDARVAAARGDCAAARTITARIAKLDTTYYKTKVVPDPALAACQRR